MIAVPRDSELPWAPEDLPVAAKVLTLQWSYVVLEEIVDGAALLRRWPWPVVDPLGHLLWPDDSEQQTTSATVDVDDLRTQLYQPSGIQRRPRCGDTFAVGKANDDAWRAGRHHRDVSDLFGDAAYDISADAREAAKIAYQGSMASVRPADEVVRSQEAQLLEQRRAQQLPSLTIAAPGQAGPAPRRSR